MKAAILESAQNLKVINLPEICPNESEVKVKVHSCGICGSDVHEYKNGLLFWLPSRIGGHEFGGTIIEKGKAVRGLNIGDKVVIKLGYSCGNCYYCLKGNSNLCIKNNTNLLSKGGGFAEYSVIPFRQIVKLPEGFDLNKAVLIEPMATAIHASKKIDISAENHILIVGSGTIALLLVKWIRKRNPEAKIILVCKYSYIANLAENDCLVLDLRNSDTTKIISNYSINYAFDCAGSQESYCLAYQAINQKGNLIILSIFKEQIILNLSDLMFSEKTILGSFLYTDDEFMEAVQVVNDRLIDYSEIISNTVCLSDIEKGFKELVFNKDKNLKISVFPD